jgi:hypothetical protein
MYEGALHPISKKGLKKHKKWWFVSSPQMMHGVFVLIH